MACSDLTAGLSRVLLVAALGAGAAHCGNGSSSGSDPISGPGLGGSGGGGASSLAGASGACAAAQDQLRDCGIADVSLQSCDPTIVEVACLATCLADADCQDLREWLRPEPGLELSQEFVECLEDCVWDGAFVCADGSNVFSMEWVCDGRPDCLDGSDEENCPDQPESFDCADRSDTIPLSWVCDGSPDCLDGSDEAGC